MQYYISDIRRIVIVSLSTFVILLAVAIPYHDLIFRHILQPIITHYDGSRLIMTQITEAVTLPLTIGSLLALMGTLPITLFMMWRFIRGALLPEERQWLKKCMIAAIMMFYLGITASVYCIVPMMLNFFFSIAPSYVTLMPSAMSLCLFIIRFSLMFGILSLTPIALLGLIQLNMITPNQLINHRRTFVVLSFVLGMLLTPPDIISQIMVAIPLIIIFEITIIMAKRIQQKRDSSTTT